MTDKEGKRGKKQNQEYQISLFNNILNSSNKIQCDDCKVDITKKFKILSPFEDYCVSCFANLQYFPETYFVVGKFNYPLFESNWTADEELLLLQGLEKHGYGNWGEISEMMNTNKSCEQIENHYHNVYLNYPKFIPVIDILTKKDAQGRLITTQNNSAFRKVIKGVNRENFDSNIPMSNRCVNIDRASLTLNNCLAQNKSESSAEIVGYYSKRADFQIEYNNDAQLLLAQMEFNDDDNEVEKQRKIRLIQIYNRKIVERNRKKQFIISRKLLDLKEQIRLDKVRTKQQKQIYSMMKPFARFLTAEQYQRLVQGIIKQKQIRQKIQELKQLKKKGFRSISEVEDELQNRKLKNQKLKRKQYESGRSDGKPFDYIQHKRRGALYVKQNKEIECLSSDQIDICQNFKISEKIYLMVRETIIRESLRKGNINKEQIIKMFRIENHIVSKIFDFLVEKEQINA